MDSKDGDSLSLLREVLEGLDGHLHLASSLEDAAQTVAEVASGYGAEKVVKAKMPIDGRIDFAPNLAEEGIELVDVAGVSRTGASLGSLPLQASILGQGVEVSSLSHGNPIVACCSRCCVSRTRKWMRR